MAPPEKPGKREGDVPEEVRDLGAGAASSLDDAFAAFGAAPTQPKKEEAKSLDTDDSLSFEDAVRQAAAEGLSRVDAGVSEVQDSPLLDADLDRIEHQSAGAGALRDREDMLAATDAEVRARHQQALTKELAESAYDESVMGGVYVGAFAGALIGLLIYRFDFSGRALTVAGASAGLAILGALIGYGVGGLLGRGARAAVSSQRASSVMLSRYRSAGGASDRSGCGSHRRPVQDERSYRGRRGTPHRLRQLRVCLPGRLVPRDGVKHGRRVGPALCGVPAADWHPCGAPPQGEMVDCANCDKKMLAHLQACPHCGYQPKAGQVGPEELDLDHA